jgi:hypothetical protein
MANNKLQDAVKKLIQEVIDEGQAQNGTADNEQGQIVSVDSDGTLTVQTASGLYSGVATPTIRTVGEPVLVVTADGQRVAV